MAQSIMAKLLLFLAALLSTASGSNLRRRTITTEQFLLASDAAKPITLDIQTAKSSRRNQTAPYLYGIMFEDISHSGDGGIYGELLINRGFHGSAVVKGNMELPIKPDLTGWAAVGDCKIALDTKNPLSKALPNVVRVTVPANSKGECGISNSGWWGIDVRPQAYRASFHVKSARQGAKATFRVGLRSASSGEFASTKVDRVLGDHYEEVTAEFKNTASAPNTNNIFTLTVDGSEAAGQTFYFGLVSLFGETFKGRKNGLRKDIAEAFNDLRPKFLRFPGGNNLEGVSRATHWKWKDTVGPLKDRPGRPGNWNYYNTDGLGLLEYLEWCEDMNMEPVLAVYAGYALGGKVRDASSEEMKDVLQEALDMLEYCMGSASTPYGALRAKHGHPKPVPIKFVEIGNEDWFSKEYPRRWNIMYHGLKKAYPAMTYISTVQNESGNNMTLPRGTMWDTHHYEQPRYFLKNFNFYDHWRERMNQPGVGVLLGEYSVIQADTSNGVVDWGSGIPTRVKFPQLLSALAEGVYALGGERNPDTVWMSSYAPSLMRKEQSDWTPNMIYFTTDQTRTVRSPSYWQQWMFARYRGTHTLAVDARGALNPLFWAASIDEPSGVVYLKVINTGPEAVPLTVNLGPEYSRANATILTSRNVNDANDFDNMDVVRPKPVVVGVQKGKMQWQVPRWSITILKYSRS